ncbi:MAG: GNAT family N-acetyltransferase [Acetobacteraceae bacterium]|nr:GNAT family N-acetyltransferase [Acetobacteraceae bacterium]
MEIVTPRLRLRPMRDGDRAAFAALNADPEAMRYFTAPMTRDQSDALFDRTRQRWAREGFGLAGVYRGEEWIGLVGLARVYRPMPFAPAVEIGWRMARPHWRRGYAEEAARAMLAWGFGPLALPEIVAFTIRANAPSWRLMEKLGMTPEGEFDHPAFPDGHRLRRHLLYRARPPRSAA